MNLVLTIGVKFALVLAAAGIAMTWPPVVAAGGTYISVGVGYNGGHYGHRYKTGYRHHGYKGHGYHGVRNRHHKPYGYHHYGYRGYKHKHAAEKVLVGGLISYRVNKHNRRHRHYYHQNYAGHRYLTYTPVVHTVVVKENPDTKPPARTLLKDRNGDCFQIHRNALGDEIRVHLPSYECNL